MKIPRKVVETVEATTIEIHAKVCDSGTYTLKDLAGRSIAIRDDYVPKFFPGEHYGDYIILEVDLATGQILNWPKSIDPSQVARDFNLIQEEEE